LIVSSLCGKAAGKNGAIRGSTVATRAAVPMRTKYAESTKLTRSLGKNLKARNKEKSMIDPIKGNFIASFFVIASVGGSALTERQDPTKTVAAAVKTMLMFVGMGTKRGSMEMMMRTACARGAGTPLLASTEDMMKEMITADKKRWALITDPMQF
jgi:hypothetical protein